uniref:CSON001961 protein n=1 Tax=Culicoides sonorensis TaxID=179676 RepID=A0A336MHW3_CULSO
MFNRFLYIVLIFSLCVIADAVQQPYYLTKCVKDDPDVNECLIHSGNRLIEFLRKGVPELDIIDVEPVIIDEISISLGTGPDAYKSTFKNVEAYGVSNLTLTNVRSDIDSLQYQLTFEIPRIVVSANYDSSGVLLLVKASGKGDYWGEYENVKAKVYFKAIPAYEENGLTYMTVETAKLDFSVKDIRMGVENLEQGNAVLQAALNLFINTNSQELLKEMKPDLRSKLTQIMEQFMNRLFEKIPLEQWHD